MRFSRADRSLISDWWFSVDRVLLGAILVLMAIGLMVSYAAGPPMAQRLGLPPSHFVVRHAIFLALALPVFFCVSLLSPRAMRRLCLLLLLGGMVLMVLVLLKGIERNGAMRWILLGGVSLQPSELVKPVFTVISAWLLSEGVRRSDVPALPLSLALLAAFTGLLVVEPDVGQTVLITLVWATLFFLAGYGLKGLFLLGAVMAGGLAVAYNTFPHVRARVEHFMHAPPPAANRQTDLALSAFQEGGWLGRGPGEGLIKMNLPDANTDYVFAVVGEEFGIITCLFLAALYALIAWRGLTLRAGESRDFENLAKTGLTVMLIFQALTNMAVNVNLIPSKGVTLPLISYGGSSLISVALALGLVLGLSRRRPAESGAAMLGGWRSGAVSGYGRH
jgi:cell division protein FtsW